MYSRMLIPLDESIIAEQVLPYARYLAKALAIPVELLEVVDSEALKLLANPERGRYIDTVLADRKASGRNYLETIAGSFQGARVTFSVENGKAEELIIDKAAADKDTLIVMATHGRSGMQRWLLGSVADKVLHGSTNHLFLIRATEQGKTDGEAALKKVIVPLDGSPLAEKVLPYVVDFGKKCASKWCFCALTPYHRLSQRMNTEPIAKNCSISSRQRLRITSRKKSKRSSKTA